MPRILAHCGWETRAAPFLADANDDPIATTVLPFRLHDSLALLASSSGDALHAAKRRVYAGMLMNDSSQFLRSAQIFAADKRHPTLAGNHSLYYRIRAWPGSIDSAPGGLLGQERDRRGQHPRRTSPGWTAARTRLRRWTAGGSRETEIYRAIASNARDHGLSESLRNGLESAVKDSTFNNPDIETMLALAAKAPRQMPASLAGKIPSLIASGEQKAANTAALGQACKALGMADSAKFLFRWSVALDIQNKGSSRWLGDYLAALPEEQRRDTLKTLLPYMGINAIRRDSGGDEAVLFTALLDLGMKEETNGMLDRYLQRQGTGVEGEGDRAVLGEDRDTPLSLQGIGVEHARETTLASRDGPALAEQGIDERRLAVIDVRDDGEVAMVGLGRQGHARNPEGRQ